MKTKNQKGITLVALIITIVVMMILVAVSVTVALQSGLFSAALGAANDMEYYRDNEIGISKGKVTVEGAEYNSMQEYIDTLESSAGSGTGEMITFKVMGTQYTVEDGTTWGEFIQNFKTTEEYQYGSYCGGSSDCSYNIVGSWFSVTPSGNVKYGVRRCECGQGTLREDLITPNYHDYVTVSDPIQNYHYRWMTI